jgi:hypothetical protein
MQGSTQAEDSTELPKISSEGYKLLAENLNKGDVVEYAYESDGEVTESVGVIAKANRGGIRIIRPDGRRFPLLTINCYGGTVKKHKGNGATDYSTKVGTRGRVVRTGKTASVDTKRAGRVYTTDYEA